MADLNPYRFLILAEPPPPVKFLFDKLLAVRIFEPSTGEVLLDTTDAPVSVVQLLANCTAEDLDPVIETWALAWLLKQRGLSVG